MNYHKDWERAWRSPAPRAEYDAVIVGAGGHGLATAYYLAKNHKMTNIAVVEKGWLGGGNTGRNTTIIRSNYLQDPSIAIYELARSLYEDLSQDLNYNVMFSPRGVMMLAQTHHEVRGYQRTAHANALQGVATADWAAASIPLRKGITPAMRFFGWVDWLALAAAVACALILLDLQILKILKRRPRELAATQSGIEPGLAAKTLVIMPTYNETESLERVANHLLATVPEVSLLIVDDNSPDGTGQQADKLAASNARVSVLHRQQKNGLGPAYLAGFAWGFECGFEYLVEMDADGSHRAEDLTQMLAQAEQNDLVIGSRWVPGGKIVPAAGI